jgi:hypothetical protein
VQANSQETDRLQRVVARLVATSPAGVNLLLIGGFRYGCVAGKFKWAGLQILFDMEYLVK